MPVKMTNITCEPGFKTWGQWFAFIPILLCFAFAAMLAISTFIGFIAFAQSMGFSSLKALLIAVAAIFSGIFLVALIARFLAFRWIRNKTFKFGCIATALIFTIGAFAYGVMISVYPVELTGRLLFGMTVASSPAFLAGWFGIWFVLMFKKELDIAREEVGEPNSITEVSPSAKIISLSRK